MSTCYIFDIDGTLTSPRKPIKARFARKFIKWAEGKQIYVATGSDWDKVLQQLPQDTLDVFKGIFCCMGNELRSPIGLVIEKSKFIIPDTLNDDLARILTESKYPDKTGMHIEFRTGMVNFSTVGRRATFAQRGAYSNWDRTNNERQAIVDYVNNNYPGLEASIGGSISIDIIEKGKDKGQIVPWLLDKGINKITFVGDRCFRGGNDWGIIRELMKVSLDHEWYNVNGPDDVLTLLKKFN